MGTPNSGPPEPPTEARAQSAPPDNPVAEPVAEHGATAEPGPEPGQPFTGPDVTLTAEFARTDAVNLIKALCDSTPAAINKMCDDMMSVHGNVSAVLLSMCNTYAAAKGATAFAHNPETRFAQLAEDGHAGHLHARLDLMADAWLCNAVVAAPGLFSHISGRAQDRLLMPLAALIATAIKTYDPGRELSVLAWLMELPIEASAVTSEI